MNTMPKCRACLSTEQRLVPFDNTSIESYILLTSLNVKEYDGFPQELCELCFNTIETFLTFRLNCINSEQILKAQYESIKEIQGVLSKYNESYVDIRPEADRPIDHDDDMEADSFMGADGEPSEGCEDAAEVKNEDEHMEEMEATMDCVVCNRPLAVAGEKNTTVKIKGLRTLIKCSVLRNDGLADLFGMVEEIQLHLQCRLAYIGISGTGKPSKLYFKESVSYEYDREPFNFNMKCFICTEPVCPSQTNKPGEKIVYKMKYDTTQEDIIQAIKRHNSPKNVVILHRIQNINLSEIEARYHRLCYLQVMMPNQTISKKALTCPIKKKKPLRPQVDPEIENATEFPFDTHCFFCAQKFKNAAKMSPNKRSKFLLNKIPWPDGRQEKIIQSLQKKDDEVTRRIIQRIENKDLKAMEVRYHTYCHSFYTYFLNVKPTRNTLGAPARGYVTDAMEVIYKHIAETNLKHFTITGLTKLLIFNDCNIPSVSTIKKKLIEKYGDRITVVGSPGRVGLNTYVTFHDLV